MKNVNEFIKSFDKSYFEFKKPKTVYQFYVSWCELNEFEPVSDKLLKEVLMDTFNLDVKVTKIAFNKTARVYNGKEPNLTMNPVVDIVESLKGEVWSDIEGFEGLYQVSTFGRLKRILTSGERLLSNRSLNSTGYVQVGLSKDGEVTYLLLHRMVAQAFIPNPLDCDEVDHFNNIKIDNHIDNLRWVTSQENTKHYHDMKKFRTDVLEFINAWTGEDIHEPVVKVNIQK